MKSKQVLWAIWMKWTAKLSEKPYHLYGEEWNERNGSIKFGTCVSVLSLSFPYTSLIEEKRREKKEERMVPPKKIEIEIEYRIELIKNYLIANCVILYSRTYTTYPDWMIHALKYFYSTCKMYNMEP